MSCIKARTTFSTTGEVVNGEQFDFLHYVDISVLEEVDSGGQMLLVAIGTVAGLPAFLLGWWRASCGFWELFRADYLVDYFLIFLM